MTITLNRLYTGNHPYDAGTVQINIPFVGNTLAVELSTKPEYATTKQVIGTLFQFYGNAQKSYNLYSGRDVVRLELPETDKLWFSPTSYLSDNYTLTIDFTDVGTIINGSNSIAIPEQILGLPVRVTALESNPNVSNWIDITGKPLVFNPSIHSHELSDVLGLTTALNGKANAAHTHLMNDVSGLITEFTTVNTSIGNVGNRVTALESTPNISNWIDLTGKPLVFPPAIHSHEIADVNGLLAALSNGTSAKTFSIDSIAQNETITLSDVVSGILAMYDYDLPTIKTLISPVNLTSNTSNPNFIANQSSAFTGDYGGYRLFDGQIISEPDYVSTGYAPQWISLEFLAGNQSVGSYSLFPSNVGVGNSNSPKAWQLQGSTNGTSWIVLDSQSNISGWVSNTAKPFTLASPANYRYYRLHITETTSGGGLVRLGELRLFSSIIPIQTYSEARSKYSISFTEGQFASQTVKRIATGAAKLLIKYL